MKHSKKPAFKAASSFEQRHLTVCLARIEEQRQLLVLIKSVLPPELASRIVHTLISGSRLLIYTSSASWASQIRFYNEVILTKLQASGQQKINKLQVRLLLNETAPVSRRHARLPAAATVDSLFGKTDHVPSDELGQALTRLGDMLKKKLQEQGSTSHLKRDID